MTPIFRSFLVGSFLATVACSHAATPVKGPDGQEWVAITCSHGAKSCWEEAGQFCPLGYETADEVQSSHGFLVFKHQQNEMLVRCKAPPAVAVAPFPHDGSPGGGKSAQ